MPSLPDKQGLLRQAAPRRGFWGPRPAHVRREQVGPGEESVWDYPRPPVIRPAGGRIRIDFAGETVAESDRAVKVCETAGAPVYYLPPDDVRTERLVPVDGVSVCEWKGAAVYFDLAVGERRSPQAAFSYPDPFDDLDEGYSAIAGWIGFYAGRVDAAWVGAEQARPQPGGLYAGWITDKIKGPVKGGPGSEGW